MLTLRIDVDYAYPSRIKGFISTLLKRKLGNGYLQNAKTLANLINSSQVPVKAYWFFTTNTLPDRELLALLDNGRHEVGLHIVNNPYLELAILKGNVRSMVRFFTVHGTANLVAKLIWRRKLYETNPQPPSSYPLKSFYVYDTLDLDYWCYRRPVMEAFALAKKNVAKGRVLHVHPEWLKQSGILNHRGPYIQVLSMLLKVGGLGLDVGCGVRKPTGFIGVDIDRNTDVDVVASALCLPFKDGVFSEVHSRRCIQHIKESGKAIGEVNRVLAVGGCFRVIVAGWRGWLWHQFKFIVHKPCKVFRMYSVKSMKRSLEKHKFIVTEANSVNTGRFMGKDIEAYATKFK